ncbi:MAG: hypothetical protein IPG44_19520 [Anaerolineales bacterium]|jgi:hypothetical protein|nr:hypothetical protein [Anaerolineales bacterium]MCC6985543.1 hypothetical protein [Anaerolineales bacterium]
MTLLSAIAFTPAILLGALTVCLVWPPKLRSPLLLILSIGAGLGMGLSSILYFIALQFPPGRLNMPVLQTVLALVLAVFVFRKYRRTNPNVISFPSLSWFQWCLVGLTAACLAVSVLVFANYVISRPQGALDAWSVWNRAARFIYRDPEHWAATLSPDLPLLRHADYPLLVPLNVAWGWDALGNETLRVPMMQGGIFTFATIFLLFGAISLIKTPGQASLATLALIALSGIVPSGTSLVADVPLSYFILASAILMYLYALNGDLPLLAVSGFMAGLCGWTKNEGLIFIAVSGFALLIAASGNFKKALAYYLAGLLLPLMMILYFKSLSPPNDLIANTGTGLLDKILDPDRYMTIIKSFMSDFLKPHAVIMYLYTLFMGVGSVSIRQRGVLVLTAVLVLQILGYGAVYLVTPYDLDWHLLTSQQRLIFQIIPLSIFLCFCVSADPESVFFFHKAEADTGAV